MTQRRRNACPLHRGVGGSQNLTAQLARRGEADGLPGSSQRKSPDDDGSSDGGTADQDAQSNEPGNGSSGANGVGHLGTLAAVMPDGLLALASDAPSA